VEPSVSVTEACGTATSFARASVSHLDVHRAFEVADKLDAAGATLGALTSGYSVDDRCYARCYARLQQLGELCGSQGPAEEVALSFRATLGLKVCPL
jgi:hypothetical protein